MSGAIIACGVGDLSPGDSVACDVTELGCSEGLCSAVFGMGTIAFGGYGVGSPV